MQTDDRTALQERYPWLFSRFPFLNRTLVVSDRINNQNVVYPGLGEKLRLEICTVKCATFEEFYFGVNEIHKSVGNFLAPRRCTAFRADGSTLIELGIHPQNKVLLRRRDFDLEQVKHVVSTWREPDGTGHATMLVLIEVKH